MKPIKDMLDAMKPEAIQKMLGKDNVSAQFYEAFKQELDTGNIQEFTKQKIVITNSFICDYSSFVLRIGRTLLIRPLNSIANAYRTTIINGQYNFDFVSIKLDYFNRGCDYLNMQSRKGKDISVYDEVLDVLKPIVQQNAALAANAQVQNEQIQGGV